MAVEGASKGWIVSLISIVMLFLGALAMDETLKMNCEESYKERPPSPATTKDSSVIVNPIHQCLSVPKRKHNRKTLADCAVGFGKNAIGGRDGNIYTVTDSSDENPVETKPGTLRYAVIQDQPLWIVFAKSMTIKLKYELIMNSNKTIDGRGTKVNITGGGCITLQYITNVIIHGVQIFNCYSTGNVKVRSSPTHYGWRTMSDGDAISIFGSSNIWINQNSLSNCNDGLIDVIMGSTNITISNNLFTNHNETILLGHNDTYYQDRKMQVTIAYNHFGDGLVQRMPRCRLGNFHVVNNLYTNWKMYAIGGSGHATINSERNMFIASHNPFAKEVTKRTEEGESLQDSGNWRSKGDLFLNKAFFKISGSQEEATYAKASSLEAMDSALVPDITSKAGAWSG